MVILMEQRWEFPSKQNPAHKNAPLVVRIKELWERNTSQKDMLRKLHAEGFDIKERELMRVRAKNRWLLRVPNGMKGTPQDSPGSNGTRTIMQQLEQAIMVRCCVAIGVDFLGTDILGIGGEQGSKATNAVRRGAKEASRKTSSDAD